MSVIAKFIGFISLPPLNGMELLAFLVSHHRFILYFHTAVHCVCWLELLADF